MAQAMDNGGSGVKWMQDPGWRGVVGFIVPPFQAANPTEFLRIAPEGFQVIEAKVYVPGWEHRTLIKGDVEPAERYHQELEHCCLALKQANVDVIAQYGTHFSFLAGDFFSTRNTCVKLEKVSGLPVVMMGLAVVNALQKMGYDSVALACTLYGDDVGARYARFLEDAGIKVHGVESFVSQKFFADQEEVERLMFPRHSYTRPPIGLVYRAARIVAEHYPEAKCILIAPGAVFTADILEALEQDTGKPVICSMSATFWEIFGRLGVHPVIRRRGSLLGSLARSRNS